MTRPRAAAHRDRFQTQALDEVDRQVMQLEIERQALKRKGQGFEGALGNIEKDWRT